MNWWSPPKQRQRWHSPEVLPADTDAWGQIFYDLFYVGGAYNLGNVLKHAEHPSAPRSLLYFAATGLTSMATWRDKLRLDARFATRPGRDAFHRGLEVVQRSAPWAPRCPGSGERTPCAPPSSAARCLLSLSRRRGPRSS